MPKPDTMPDPTAPAFSFEPASANAILRTTYYPGQHITGLLCLDGDEITRVSVLLQRTLTLKGGTSRKINKVKLAEQVVYDSGALDVAGERRDAQLQFSIAFPLSEPGCEGFAPSLPGWV